MKKQQPYTKLLLIYHSINGLNIQVCKIKIMSQQAIQMMCFKGLHIYLYTTLHCFVPTMFCCCHVWWAGFLQINDRPPCLSSRSEHQLTVEANKNWNHHHHHFYRHVALADKEFSFHYFLENFTIISNTSQRQLYPVLVTYWISQEFGLGHCGMQQQHNQQPVFEKWRR